MASPQVARIVALMVGRGQLPSEIREDLIRTAINPTGDPLLGAGSVQVGRGSREQALRGTTRRRVGPVRRGWVGIRRRCLGEVSQRLDAGWPTTVETFESSLKVYP